MKNVIASVVVLTAITWGCSSEKKSEAQSTQEEAKTETVIQASATQVSPEQLESILSSYFNVKDALVKTDAKEAKSALAKLLESVGSEIEGLKSLTQKMSKKDDVEEIRADFEDLSQHVYVLVKGNTSSKDEVVYKQYCPMAFDNQGAFWLSDKKEIRNPYFGDKMLKCGKVQEEI